MKSHIAGIMLAGSLATAQGIENTPVSVDVVSPLVASSQIQQKQKDRLNFTLDRS